MDDRNEEGMDAHLKEQPLLYVTMHPLKSGKWAVVAYIGECASMDEAKRLAEEVGPKLGNALMGKK